MSGDRNQSEVYVQPIPATGALWLISKNGGTMPRWCCQGRELFYRANDGQLQDVPSAGTAQPITVVLNWLGSIASRTTAR